jgi:hypothetical protein
MIQLAELNLPSYRISRDGTHKQHPNLLDSRNKTWQGQILHSWADAINRKRVLFYAAQKTVEFRGGLAKIHRFQNKFTDRLTW